MGARAYRLMVNYDVEGAILEIGSDRGEGSTAFWAALAQRCRVPFYSVDFDAEAYLRARRIPGSQAYQITGEAFLRTLWPGKKQRIGLAYLDNFDWQYPSLMGTDQVRDQIRTYRQHGLTMTNAQSQAAHLVQTRLIVPYASRQSIIMFDATWRHPDGTWTGKGGLAVPFLLAQSYQVLHSAPEAKERFDGFVVMGRAQ